MEWEPIETAPKDGTIILAHWLNGEDHTGSIWEGKWVPAWDTENDWAMPTHWLPIPDPPTRAVKSLSHLRGAFPGDIVEIEVPARSSTSKDGMRYRGRLVSRET